MNQVGKAIHSAQSEITRLNQRLRALSNTKGNQSSLVTYANVIQYNMLKAEAKIQQTFQSILNQSSIEKTRLPMIKMQSNHQRNNLSMLGMSKNEDSKRSIRLRSVRRLQDRQKINSTKQYISIPIENRPVKMHSFIEKHIRNNILTDDKPVSHLKQQIPQNLIKPLNFQNQFINETLSTKHQKMIQQMARNQLAKEQIQIKLPQMILTILDGNLVVNNNQYYAFSHIYQTILPKINQLLKTLLRLLKENRFRQVTIKGRTLAQVAINDESTKDLIHCIVQQYPRQMLLQKIAKYDGKEGQAKAAALIQSIWKMSAIRKQYIEFKDKVAIIQRYAQKYMLKMNFKRSIKQRSTQIYHMFQTRQSKLMNNLQNIQSSPHFEIHLNGFNFDQLKRLTTTNLTQKKNIQLTRLFRLKNPNISIIYISSNPLTIQTITYYYRTLELLNIDYHNRLFFLTTEAFSTFPKHFSTSKLLYYSPKCLNKIKQIIKNKECFLVPGYPCSEDIKICHELNCYMLSSDPLKSKILCSKYQSRQLFSSSGVPVLPAVSEFSDISEMINSFAITITKNPNIKNWVFKIDDEFEGRGIAQYSLSKSILYILKELIPQDNQQQFFGLTNVDDQNSINPNQQLFTSIAAVLHKSLPSKLRISMPSLFANYSEFMQAFIRKGGIIEASLSQFETKSPSISIFLQPDGNFNIISTFQKLQSQPYINIACKSPQQIISFEAINDCCQKICDTLHQKGCFGFYSIDLLAYKSRHSSQYQFFTIGLDSYLNNYACSFFYFNALMNGRFLPEQNCYLIQQSTFGKQSKFKEQVSQITHESTIIQPRKYFYSPYVFNPYFYKTTLKTFFKSAKFADINYDFTHRQGICILIMDEAISGVMSLMSIYETEEDMITGMYNSTQFIDRCSQGDRKQTYGNNILNSRKDKVLIGDILSLFSRLKQRKDRQKGKALLQKKQNFKSKILDLI